MVARALEVVLTLLFAPLLGGVFLWATGASSPDDFLFGAPALFIASFWIGILVWIALLVISAIRARSRGRERRPWNNVACAAGAAVVNFVALTIIGFSLGGYSVFLSITSAVAGVIFVVSATIASLIVRAIMMRRTSQQQQSL